MKKRLTIYAAVCGLLAALWFFFIYAGFVSARQVVDNQIAETEAQLEDYEQTIQSLPEFLAASKDLEAFKHQLNSSLYDKSEILKLLQQITNDAANHNLTVVEISPPIMELLELNRVSDVADEPLFLNLTLNLQGLYVDFGRYVSKLESRPYFRAVNTCEIRGASGIPYLELSIGFRALIGTPLEES